MNDEELLKGYKELSEAQGEYIEFLSEMYSNRYMFCYTHGIRDSEENMNRGNLLRKRISDADTSIQNMSKN